MRRSAYMAGNREQTDVVVKHLAHLLAHLRAMYLSYQTSHWQTKGPTYYGNHLLFQRLYESVQGEVDTLAEKIVGYVGPAGVNLDGQADLVSSIARSFAAIPDHHRRGLAAEDRLQRYLKLAYDSIKESGAMTLGLDDFLMATASAHETNVYLLQQVLDERPAARVASKSNQRQLLQHVQDLVEDIEREGFDRLKHRYLGIFQDLHDAGALTPDILTRVNAVNRTIGRHGTGDASDTSIVVSFLRDLATHIRNMSKVGAVSREVPTAEAFFFDNPERREVREFAHSKAHSNVPAIANTAGREEGLTRSELREDVARARIAPPTPADIEDRPGADEFSTLNRYLVETEQPTDPGVPSGHDEIPKHRRIDPSNDDIILADGTVIDPSGDDHDVDGHGRRIASWTFAPRR